MFRNQAYRLRFLPVNWALLRLPANKTMYAIRHTFICDLLENGEDPLTVMKISGHKSWDAFKQYADKYLKKPVDDYTDKLTVVF